MLYVWSKYNSSNHLARDCIIAYAKLDPDLRETITKMSVQNITKVILGRLLTMSMVVGPVLSKLNDFNELISLMSNHLYCSIACSPPSLTVTLNCNTLEERLIDVEGHTKYDVSYLLRDSHLSITVTGLSNIVVQNTLKLIDGGIGADIVDWIKQPANAIWGECSITGGCGVAIVDDEVDNACAFLVVDFTSRRTYTNRASQDKNLRFPSRYLMTEQDLLKCLGTSEQELVSEMRIKFDLSHFVVRNN